MKNVSLSSLTKQSKSIRNISYTAYLLIITVSFFEFFFIDFTVVRLLYYIVICIPPVMCFNTIRGESKTIFEKKLFGYLLFFLPSLVSSFLVVLNSLNPNYFSYVFKFFSYHWSSFFGMLANIAVIAAYVYILLMLCGVRPFDANKGVLFSIVGLCGKIISLLTSCIFTLVSFFRINPVFDLASLSYYSERTFIQSTVIGFAEILLWLATMMIFKGIGNGGLSENEVYKPFSSDTRIIDVIAVVILCLVGLWINRSALRIPINYSSSSSSSYEDNSDYTGNGGNKSDGGYKEFMDDVDKAGNGDGKADWDDWNAYAEENGYNKAY